MDFTPEQLLEASKQIGALIDNLGIGYKHDPASTVSNAVLAHGPGGLFSSQGVRPGMYSTVPRPVDLASIIPLVKSVNVNERWEVLTGVTVTEGTRATDICSEGPTPGQLKVCSQVFTWGEMKIDTRTQRLNEWGRRNNYADMDRNVFNLMSSSHPLMPQFLTAENVNTDFGKLVMEVVFALEKSFASVDVNGVAGGTSAPAGVVNSEDYRPWISQYAGLYAQIATGKVDSVSQAACPAADSVVITHNAPIASNGTNGLSFVQNVVNLVRSPLARANRVGMGDFNFVLGVHPNAWWAISDQWACQYNVDRCNDGAAGDPVIRNATDITEFRDAMRNGNYLLVDGMRIPVVFADGLQWDGVNNNTFSTDILLLPLNWRGQRLLYRQYFPLNNPQATAWQNFVGPLGSARILNDGLYAMGARTTNGMCSKAEFYSQTRLILDTPWLAGRLNDVQVSYTVQGYDVFPGMSNYRDGGESSRF